MFFIFIEAAERITADPFSEISAGFLLRASLEMQAATPRRRCQDWSSETPAKPGAAHPDPRGAGGPGTLRYRGLRSQTPTKPGVVPLLKGFWGCWGGFWGC